MNSPPASSSSVSQLCWVLAEALPPHYIIEASPLWYAVWRCLPENVIGLETLESLNGEGYDRMADRALHRTFAANNAATHRCRHVAFDGSAIEHTASIMWAMDGILLISKDIHPPPIPKLVSAPRSLHDIGASIAAEMHATRSGPAPEAAAVRVAQIEALVMQFESQLEELVLHESAATWGKSWDEASMIVDVGVKLPLHESTDAAANFNVRAPTSKLHYTTFS